MKDVRSVNASNGVCYLQTRSIGSHSTSGREKEGKKERKKERRKERKKEGKKERKKERKKE